MTIAEAAADGIKWLRLPEWQPRSYIKLFLPKDGGYGPWMYLFDRNIQEVMGYKTPMPILIEGHEARYEKFVGTVDQADRDW